MLYQLCVIRYNYCRLLKSNLCKELHISKGQIDIFVFFTLNSKYNLVCLFRVFVFHISIESL